MKKTVKLFTSKAVEINEKERTAKFVISDDLPDRMEEIVEQSWQTDNYENNPIVLWGHDPSQPENVLGQSLGLETEKGKDGVTRTSSTVKFSDEGVNAKADMVFKQVVAGILRTVSVGFIPHSFKTNDENVDVLADNELLEFSLVPIPANPRAVALAYKEGAISRKDAKFMIESMKKESELLQEELDSDNNNNKEIKEMSDEDIAKIAEAVGTAVSEALAPVVEKIDAIAEAVSADAGEGDEDTDTGTDDGTQGGDSEGEDEGDKGKKSKSQDEAKDGEDDQSGAEDDEVEEDAELTDEQEKAFAEEFEKALKEEQEN